MSEQPRARGTGRVFRPKGCQLWYIRYYDAREHATKSGRLTKMRTESSGSTSRAVAERLLRDRLGRKDRGETITNPGKVTFADLVQLIRDNYAANRRRSGSRLETALKPLTRFFGGCRAIDVAPRWPRYMAERQAAKRSNQTIMIERIYLRRAFTLAVQAGLLPGVPYLARLDVDNVRTRVLDDDETAAILAELPEDIRGALTFGALTGWRTRSEVLPLTWDRVDMERGVIRWEVGTTKNRAGRVLVFRTLPALGALLVRWRAITDATEARLHKRVRWVFHRNGWRVQKKRYYQAWHDACAKAEVRDAIPHDLRRAAVVRFERAGVPRKTAMSITGHKTESVYGRYNIVREAEQEVGLAKVTAVLPSALAQ